MLDSFAYVLEKHGRGFDDGEVAHPDGALVELDEFLATRGT